MGSKNNVTEISIYRSTKAYHEHGAQAIEDLKKKNPEEFLRIVHELLPEVDVLADMKAVMAEEEEGGEEMIDDVLFSAFFVQR